MMVFALCVCTPSLFWLGLGFSILSSWVGPGPPPSLERRASSPTHVLAFSPSFSFRSGLACPFPFERAWPPHSPSNARPGLPPLPLDGAAFLQLPFWVVLLFFFFFFWGGVVFRGVGKKKKRKRKKEKRRRGFKGVPPEKAPNNCFFLKEKLREIVKQLWSKNRFRATEKKKKKRHFF